MVCPMCTAAAVAANAPALAAAASGAVAAKFALRDKQHLKPRVVRQKQQAVQEEGLATAAGGAQAAAVRLVVAVRQLPQVMGLADMGTSMEEDM